MGRGGLGEVLCSSALSTTDTRPILVVGGVLIAGVGRSRADPEYARDCVWYSANEGPDSAKGPTEFEVLKIVTLVTAGATCSSRGGSADCGDEADRAERGDEAGEARTAEPKMPLDVAIFPSSSSGGVGLDCARGGGTSTSSSSSEMECVAACFMAR